MYLCAFSLCFQLSSLYSIINRKSKHKDPLKKNSTQDKTCPSGNFFYYNFTLIGLGSNPVLRGERTVTELLKDLITFRPKTLWICQYVTAGSSSSFYWPSVANAPNVLQPYWFIVLPLDVPDLTASLLLWGPSSQRWRCLLTFLFFECSNFRH